MARNSLAAAVGVVAGMAGAIVLSKVGAPVAAQWLGATRGLRALDGLILDHRAILAILKEMEATDDQAVALRMKLLLKAKLALTAHALAEEDVVYPLVGDVVHERDKMSELFAEHAEVKVFLAELERLPKSGPEWAQIASRLRRTLEDHARDEEEHVFPALRAALDPQQAALMGGGVLREKALLV